jgi:hypothetical protein
LEGFVSETQAFFAALALLFLGGLCGVGLFGIGAFISVYFFGG